MSRMVFDEYCNIIIADDIDARIRKEEEEEKKKEEEEKKKWVAKTVARMQEKNKKFVEDLKVLPQQHARQENTCKHINMDANIRQFSWENQLTKKTTCTTKKAASPPECKVVPSSDEDATAEIILPFSDCTVEDEDATAAKGGGA